MAHLPPDHDEACSELKPCGTCVAKQSKLLQGAPSQGSREQPESPSPTEHWPQTSEPVEEQDSTVDKLQGCWVEGGSSQAPGLDRVGLLEAKLEHGQHSCAKGTETFSEYDMLVSGLQPQQDAAEPDAPIVPEHIKTEANASDKGQRVGLVEEVKLDDNAAPEGSSIHEAAAEDSRC